MPRHRLLPLILFFTTTLTPAQTPTADPSTNRTQNLESLRRPPLRQAQGHALPDFVSVYNHVSNRDQLLAGMKSCTLHTYDMRDPHITHATPDLAVLTYIVTETLTCNGQPVAHTSNISSTWLRRNNTWQALLHTETDIPNPNPPT